MFLPKRGKFSRGAALPIAPSTAHGTRSAAATELRRSRCCDGVAAETSSVALILRVASATELMLLRAATELMLRAALLRRSCDGVAAATEQRRPAPSRSFCASRLDATR